MWIQSLTARGTGESDDFFCEAYKTAGHLHGGTAKEQLQLKPSKIPLRNGKDAKILTSAEYNLGTKRKHKCKGQGEEINTPTNKLNILFSRK